jgi:MFS family permease
MSSPPLRRNVRFQFMWAGSAISALGSRVSTLAYPLVILVITGSPALAGLVGAVGVATFVLFGLPAGALVDRWDRRRVLLGCDAVRAVAVATVAIAVAGGWLTIAHIVVVAALEGVASALYFPARIVAIRGIVPKDRLGQAFGQEEARTHAVAMAGPPLGGILFGLGTVVPFVVDALTYAVSFVFHAFARVPRRPARKTPPPEPTRGQLRREIVDGVRWLLRERLVRAMVFSVPMLNVAGAAVTLLVIVLLRSRGVPPSAIGLVLAAEGVAGLLGAAVAARLVRLLPAGRLLLVIAWSWAAILPLMTLPLGVWWIAVLIGAGVALTPALTVLVTTQILTTAPEDMQGRVMSALGTLAGAVSPLGPLMAGILAEAFGPVVALFAVGAYVAVSAAAITTSPVLRRGENVTPETARKEVTTDA